MNPATLPTLSASQLAREIARAEALSSALCSEMIAAGRGYELPTQTRKLSDPLAVRCNAASLAASALYLEREMRMQWHGSTKPIKREGVAA